MVIPNNDARIRRLEALVLRLERQLSIATSAIDLAKRLRYETGKPVEYRDAIRSAMEKAQDEIRKLENLKTK